MSREVRRVPLDFDWPQNEVWSGYLMPDTLDLPQCPTCRGDGLTVEARAIEHTFYPHQIGGPHADALAWCDKLGQAEVDHLQAEGRLQRTWDAETRTWITVPLTAEQVNAANRPGGRGFGNHHDAINRWILVRFRCERLGITLQCSTCSGSGEVASSEQRAAHEAWERTDPPSGEGWQLWETVSEGSPVSPVFSTRGELVRWLSTTYRTAMGERLTEQQAERFVEAGHSVGSFYVSGGQLVSGEVVR